METVWLGVAVSVLLQHTFRWSVTVPLNDTWTESVGSVPHKQPSEQPYGASNNGRARTMQAIITRGGTV